MKWRFALVTLSLAAMTFVLALKADDTGKSSGKTDPSGQVREDLTIKEQVLSRQFAEFQQSLLRLKQKLERSTKQEDRERAKILDRVLQKAKDELISTQFGQLVDFLRDQRFSNLGDIKKAVDQSKDLAEDLRALLALMREDTRAAQLRDERLRLEDLIKKIEAVITKQKVVQGQTDLNKTEKNELKNAQNKVTQETNKIAQAIDGNKANPKGEPKSAGKDGGKSGKGKDAGEAGKSAESKEGKGDGEKAEAKGDKQGNDSPKSGDKSEKAGDAKSGKSGEGSDSKQSGAKSSKSGGEGDKGDAKKNPGEGGEKKANEAEAKKAGGEEGAKIKTKTKDEDKKSGDDQAKADAKKAGGQQGGDPKQGGAKSSQSPQQQQSAQKQSGQQQQGEAKPGSQSQGQGQPKSGGQQSPPQQAKDQQPQQPSAQQPQDDVANSKKQIEDAEYKQKQAEEKIANQENKAASDKQGDAIKDLEKAKKKLEDLLRQIREEEIERLLAALQSRCERMLAMQMQVLHGTEQVDKAVKVNPDKKASRKNEQDSLKLSDDEKEIVREADKAIEMLEAEGSAVAFPEVFQQVREDMSHVQRRLGVVDVATVTQAIEYDIIETLKEMIEALKKARQDNQAKQSKPGQQGQQPPNADQKLLEQIAELKMIRSMQIRVNKRTETYGKQYEGEQAFEAGIRNELQNLAERQDRIVTVTTQIAKGDNK